jgi:hypothetical protein
VGAGAYLDVIVLKVSADGREDDATLAAVVACGSRVGVLGEPEVAHAAQHGRVLEPGNLQGDCMQFC